MRQYETLRDMRDYSSLRNPDSFRTGHNSLRAYHPKADYEREQKRLEKLYNKQQDRLAREKQRETDRQDRRYWAAVDKQWRQARRERAKEKVPTAQDILSEITKATEQALGKEVDSIKHDEGRVKVEVRNSLQMSLRNITLSLDKMAKKYGKKNGNQHIAEGINKLKNKIEPIVEQAIEELARYMIEEERKRNKELVQAVFNSIIAAQKDIGYALTDVQIRKLVYETVTAVIQGAVTEARLDNYVYNKVDYYSRIVQ